MMMMSLLLQQQQQQVPKTEEAPRPDDKDNNDDSMLCSMKNKPTVVGDDDDSAHATAAATATTATATAAAKAKATSLQQPPVLLHRRHTTGEDAPQEDIVATLFGSSFPSSSSSAFPPPPPSSPRIMSSSARRGLIRRFSVQRSTEDYFSTTNSSISVNSDSNDIDASATGTTRQHFYGAYGHLRRQLDYKYHKHYQKERQWLHDSIIEDFLGANNHFVLLDESSSPSSSSSSSSSSCSSSCSTKDKPLLQEQQQQQQQQQQQWLIFTVGVKGSGKHHAMRTLLQSGRLPFLQDDVLFVDADEIRRVLPEYDSYSPSRVGPLTQKEAGYIAETMVLAGLQMQGGGGGGGSNGGKRRRRRMKQIFWDVTLHSATWYVQFITALRLQYPALKVAILQVTADLDQVLERVHQRSFYTGRTISREEIEETLQQIPHSVEIVKPVTDYANVILLNNNDPSPLELVQGDWEEFEQQFCCSKGQSSTTTTSSLSTTLTSFRLLAEIARQEGATTTDTSRNRRNSTMMISMPPHRGGGGSDAATVGQDDKDKELRRHGRHPSLQLHYNINSHRLLRHRRRFSVLQSTEHNHATTSNKFYGPFAHIRANKMFLDYTYHSNYTFERQHFQDAIITHFLEAAVIRDRNGILCSTPTEPWLVFTAGAMGAGKSYTMNKLVNQGRFPLLHFVVVDPDEIRRHLPEYHLYLEHQPEMAGELTRKEAGYIAELLTLVSLLAGKNTLVDGSLRDADWYCDYIKLLRREFSILRLAILHVTAPRAAVFQRAAQRAMTTGRVVPRELLIKALDQVPRSVEKLSPLVDYTAELHNAPHADDIQLVAPQGETWDSFKEQWSQTCAWEPKHIAQTTLSGKPLTKTPSSERLAAQLMSAVTRRQSSSLEPKYFGGGKQPLTKALPSPEGLQQVATSQLVGGPGSDSSDRTATEAVATTSAVATVSVSSS